MCGASCWRLGVVFSWYLDLWYPVQYLGGARMLVALSSVPGKFWLHRYEGGLARKTNQINSLQEDRRTLVRIPRLWCGLTRVLVLGEIRGAHKQSIKSNGKLICFNELVPKNSTFWQPEKALT